MTPTTTTTKKTINEEIQEIVDKNVKLYKSDAKAHEETMREIRLLPGYDTWANELAHQELRHLLYQVADERKAAKTSDAET